MNFREDAQLEKDLFVHLYLTSTHCLHQRIPVVWPHMANEERCDFISQHKKKPSKDSESVFRDMMLVSKIQAHRFKTEPMHFVGTKYLYKESISNIDSLRSTFRNSQYSFLDKNYVLFRVYLGDGPDVLETVENIINNFPYIAKLKPSVFYDLMANMAALPPDTQSELKVSINCVECENTESTFFDFKKRNPKNFKQVNDMQFTCSSCGSDHAKVIVFDEYDQIQN